MVISHGYACGARLLCQRRYAAAIRTELFGVDDLRTAEAVLAVSDTGEQEVEDSYAAMMHVLKVRKAKLPPDHKDIGVVLSSLGDLLQSEDAKCALPCFRQALAIAENSAPENVAEACNAIAHCLDELDRIVEARECFERAIRIATDLLGPEHLDTMAYRGNLGRMLANEEMEAEALPHFRATLRTFETVLGLENLETVRIRAAIGEALLMAVATDFHAGKRQGDIIKLKKKATAQHAKLQKTPSGGKRVELENELREIAGKIRRFEAKTKKANTVESLAQLLEDSSQAAGKTPDEVERLVEDEAETMMLRALPVLQDAEEFDDCKQTATHLKNMYSNQNRKKQARAMKKQIAIFDAWVSDSESDSDSSDDESDDSGSEEEEEDGDSTDNATAQWIKFGVGPELAARLADCGDEQLSLHELNQALSTVMMSKMMMDEDHEDRKELRNLAFKVTDMRDAARRRDEVSAMLESGAEAVQALRMEHERFMHASSLRAFGSSSSSGLSITESLWKSPGMVEEPEPAPEPE